MANALSDQERTRSDACWRAANYLPVGRIYRSANPLLKQPLAKEHIRPRLLAHGGTRMTPHRLLRQATKAWPGQARAAGLP